MKLHRISKPQCILFIIFLLLGCNHSLVAATPKREKSILYEIGGFLAAEAMVGLASYGVSQNPGIGLVYSIVGPMGAQRQSPSSDTFLWGFIFVSLHNLAYPSLDELNADDEREKNGLDRQNISRDQIFRNNFYAYSLVIVTSYIVGCFYGDNYNTKIFPNYDHHTNAYSLNFSYTF